MQEKHQHVLFEIECFTHAMHVTIIISGRKIDKSFASTTIRFKFFFIQNTFLENIMTMVNTANQMVACSNIAQCLQS